ncbi:hypothetical protein LJB42_003180 [Komagataella kurtzmanii]|nr:hypothetical protein LJB42_003180 [Komagataella kurtzmanii]
MSSYDSLEPESSRGELSHQPSFLKRLSSFVATGSALGNFRTLEIDFDDQERELILERLSKVHGIRPAKLIGVTKPLCTWTLYYKSEDDLKYYKSRSVRGFYRAQNEIINRYQQIDKLLESGIPFSLLKNYDNEDVRDGDPLNVDEETNLLLGYNKESESREVFVAIILNSIINVVLLVAKIFVVLFSSSLSLMASLVDSVMDFLSTMIIYVSNSFAGKRDKNEYPVGRSRLEPLGVLVFSVIIIVSFIQVGNESLKKLISGDRDVVSLDKTTISVMVFTVAAKLFAYFWCKSSKNSSVVALVEDAKTDIVFNLVSLVFPALGHWLGIWWLDPLGALLLCVYVIALWASIAFVHINNLTGSAATKIDMQTIIYLILRFSESITKITSLKAYHVGDHINVEVDVICNSKLDFKEFHDLAESIQYTIELLPYVERAFVHLDYRLGNYVGHLH